MSPFSLRTRTLAVGVLCAAGGVGAGAVATATASTSSAHHTGTKTEHVRKDHHGKGKHPLMRDLRGVAKHAASGSVVVHTKDGYKTITFERGVVDSVSGDQLTITEGSAKHAYQKDTITVPANARVRDNGKKSSLSSVTAGQRVAVIQMPKRTIVRARTAKH